MTLTGTFSEVKWRLNSKKKKSPPLQIDTRIVLLMAQLSLTWGQSQAGPIASQAGPRRTSSTWKLKLNQAELGRETDGGLMGPMVKIRQYHNSAAGRLSIT